MNQDRDTSRKLPHDIRMTTHATNNKTGFIRQSKDRTDVVGLSNNVEIDPEQGFTIKENMIQHDSISSTHLYPTAIAWRDGNSPIPANLSISNEATNEAKDRLKLVQSIYSEETWTHSVPLNIEVDGRNRPVATQTTISKCVTFSDTSPVTQNSDVIIHTIVRGKAPIISNLFTYNKHNFTAEILENVAISGSKDSAI